MSSHRDTVTEGTVLAGKYRVESTLGFGGMGLVIRAHNLQLDEPVAIKILREDVRLDGEHVERFLREAKAAVRLKSEHVAKIRDVGTLDSGRPYIVMELLEGADLGKLLGDHGCIDSVRAVELLLQACDAMAEAHANGIVHRDIKPTNLFLSRRRDGSDLLKVLDFGISKAQGPELSLTQTSSMLGTPAYMSPEQMRSARAVDARSDIWALGAVLYELVEGRPPFSAQSFAELCISVSTEPWDPMIRAPHLAPIIDRCLEKHVERRYQNVAQLAADLQGFAGDPAQAHRIAVRISRVLGVGSRDSTPIPQHASWARMPTTPSQTASYGAGPRRLTTEQRAGSGGMVLVLLLLFGVGIAAGLYVTRDQASLAAAPPDALTESAPDPARSMTVVDARVDVMTSGDAPAADAASREGSASTDPGMTIEKPPPRRKPPATPVVKPPTPTQVAPPPPLPKKKCDPFANKNGCK